MKPERWRQITDIYHAVIARGATDRVPFLEQACAGDNDLRQRVESLVEAHEEAGSFIETPAFEATRELVGEPSNALAGRVIGHYRVESLLGAGGMGEVYLAEDTRLARRVALKILPAYVARDPQRMARFQQEARAASSLSHPNVAHIYEIGEAGGTHFIAMEYVLGQALDEKIGGRPLDFADTLPIGMQIADALDEAHARGVTHRDIKSSNIIVTPRGQVKVLDFGLAKFERAPERPYRSEIATWVKTDPGVVMGTASYMSPEQALGREVDHRSDIFSLGVVLYEMAAGRLPFVGASLSETIDRVVHAQPEAIARFNYDVPGELERIVRKALQKGREDRYQTVKEMLLDLRSLKQESELAAQRGQVPGDARAAATPEQAPRTAEVAGAHSMSSAEYLAGRITRHKAGAAIVLATLVVVLGGLGFGLYRAIGRKQPAASFQQMKITRLTSSGRASNAVISPDGKYVVHVVGEGGQQSLWLRQVATTSDKEIVPPDRAPYRGVTFSPDGNFIYYAVGRGPGLTTLYQIPVLGGAARKLIEDVDSAVSFSPDGKRFAFVRSGRDESAPSALLVANADGTEERVIATRKRPGGFGEGLFASVAWSPDGRVIACNARNHDAEGLYASVVAIPAEGGAETTVTAQRWYRLARLAWLADGSGLIFQAADEAARLNSQQLWHVSYPGGEERRITNDLSDYRGVSLTADSAALVTVQTDTTSNIWVAPEGNAGRATQITTGASSLDGHAGLGWTPDGRLVYNSMASGGEHIWIMGADGTAKRQLTAGAGANYHLAVSPDGRSIVFVSERAGGRNVWRMDVDGGSQKPLSFGGKANFPQFTPDGRWVVFVSNTSGAQRLWKVSADGGEPARVSDRRMAWQVVSPDGTLIAGQVWDEQGVRMALLPFSGSEAVKVFDVQPALPLRLRWSTDGRALFYVADRDGISNIWSQPIDGGAPKQVTDFKSDRIASFDWSRDGKWLAVSRVTQANDAVLIRDFR